MKKIKSILSLVLIGVLMTSMLVGCGGKAPTAEELMENPYGTEEVTSADMDVAFAFDVAGKTEVEGMNMSLAVGIEMDMNIQYDEDTTYVKGNVEASMMGMSFEEGIEMYAQKDGKDVLTYTLDSESEEWIVDEADDDDTDYKEILGFDTDIFEDLELAEDTKDADVYIVTATAKYEDVAKSMDMDMDDMMDSLGDIDLDDVVYNITAEFDKETRILKTMEMTVDTESLDNDEFEIDEMVITITVNQINDVEVEVPSKVEKNAIEADEVTTLDYDYDYEEEESEEDDVVVNDTEEEQKPQDKPDSNIVVTDDWKQGGLTFNNNNVVLNQTTLADFLANTNYVVSDYSGIDVTTYKLNAGDTKSVNLDFGSASDDYVYLNIEVKNPTNDLVNMEDGIITGIYYKCDECVTKADKMSVAGITTGDTINDITTLLGTPEGTSSYNNDYEYSYSAEFGDDTVYLTVEVSDGICTGFSIYIW